VNDQGVEHGWDHEANEAVLQHEESWRTACRAGQWGMSLCVVLPMESVQYSVNSVSLPGTECSYCRAWLGAALRCSATNYCKSNF
jgi:hypothetical protein